MRYVFVIFGCLFFLAACKTDEERAADYFASAVALAEEGDVDRALVELRNVFDHDGFHKDARLLYADLLLSRGELDGAYRHYLRLIEQHPDTLEVRRTLVELSMMLGDWDRMRLNAEAVIALAPDTPLSRASRALLDYRAAQLNRDDATAVEAAQAARQALEEDPSLASARRVLIDWQLKGPNPETALPLLDMELERWPSDRLLRMAKLRILGRDGATDEVGAELTTLYKYYPKDPEVYDLLISWYIARGDLEGAEQFLRSEAGTDDAAPEGHVAVISFLLQSGNTGKAVAELDRLANANEGTDLGRYYATIAASAIYDSGQQAEGIARARAALEGAGQSDLLNQSRMILVRMLASQGETAEAKELVEVIIGVDPRFIEALKFRAAWALQEDRTQDALVDLRTALNEDPRNSEALILQGQAHIQLGNRELGLQSLALAVEASRNAPRESLAYARALINERRLSAAQSVLRSALDQTPDDLDISEILGTILLRGGDVDRAAALADRLAQIGSPRARSIENRLRAGVLMVRNQVDQSLALLRQTVDDSDNTDLRAILQILQTQLVAGRIEDARVYMQEVREKSPDEPFLKLLDADLHAIEGNNETAIALYQDLLKDLPASPIIAEKTYRLLRMEGRAAEASQVIEAGLQADPDSPRFQIMQAVDRENIGQLEEARDLYETLYAETPDNLVVINNLAGILAQINTPETISRASQLITELENIQNPAVLDTVGWVQFRAGNPEKAVINLETALRAVPENGIVMLHLGLVYTALGRAAEAQATLTSGLELLRRDGSAGYETLQEEAREALKTLAE